MRDGLEFAVFFVITAFIALVVIVVINEWSRGRRERQLLRPTRRRR